MLRYSVKHLLIGVPLVAIGATLVGSALAKTFARGPIPGALLVMGSALIGAGLAHPAKRTWKGALVGVWVLFVIYVFML